jgi:hypothetical protein
MEAERASVSVEEKWRLPSVEGWSGAERSSGAIGGAIREKMALRAMEPMRARP